MASFSSFVIFAEMRTGSNFLEENLNTSSWLQCYGEAFNPHFMGQKDKTELLGITLEERDRNPHSLLKAMRDKTDGLPGFRFFHDHDPRILTEMLADRNCAKIVLTRNPVDSYVSRKIAAETGQWRMTNIKTYRSATVVFDPREFEQHLEALQSFQLTLMHALQVSGQTAFYLAYEDIADIQVLNGLLRFLGVKKKLESISGRLKKQNPQPLPEKVSNFEDMKQAFGLLDRFDLSRTPNFEPRRGPAVPTLVAAAQAPILYLPVKGGPVPFVEEWLAAVDGKTPDALKRNFSQKDLRQWKRQNPGHRCFSVVSHPLERAHRAFCDHILPTGPGTYPLIRGLLMRLHKVPLPEGDPGPDFDTAAHRTAFLGFLKFLKRNLGGQTNIRVDATWASQSEVLRGMAEIVLPDMILRAERLQEDLPALAAQVGLSVKPPPAQKAGTSLADIYDEEIEAAARDAYQRDYMMFGYRAWG
ncbi:sulfotransferase domain-containing protein [Rhodovulum imhoffii]|uniref:Sulfotransferase domain-containing protein n=1 Tax=Rhodovulum imhoffii TaxID=365340 RepID=A0A2T5BP92_9RHOB|nr:sulfotransferase domain-containing protein [Rhodovulum imhoffii]MBK5932917.1 nodulation protein NodH [Rhodovulum imhoffii]PTN00853.1 sulfotransferase domain-containing protein [Rhodovulum imhoffii]